ncbi:Nif11-like leader peptide family natural product precursor [Prochlorococcus sp. MIT 1300]|uniref:Nif11-like leader peptide family natural product precursor n=1 Tax=Prochlorococcus sp. MIT 1300 TaxID=3096218 RepID=UPI0039BEF262
MSREELSNFLRSAERSDSLRRELKNCKDEDSIIKAALAYGFKITSKDLKEDPIASRIIDWFSISIIKPIRQTYTK